MIFLFISCGSQPSHQTSSFLSPVPSKAPAPSQLTEAPTAAAPEATPTEPPTIMPTEEPLPVLEDTVYNTASMYLNYSNSFPLAVTETHEIEFHYDDTITVRDQEDNSYTISLSTELFVDGYDLTDSDSWYFCGAFIHENTVYAHYDYLNGSTRTPSLLLLLEPETQNVRCCIASSNPKRKISDSFVLAGERIYYTNTRYTDYGTAITDLVSTDLQGGDSTTIMTGSLGETIPYLTTDGTNLYYAVTNLDSVSRLVAADPSAGTEQIIVNHLTQLDFLGVLGNYLLTSLQNNQLTYYDTSTSKQFTLSLANSSLTAGFPMTDGIYLYVPLISYAGKAPTELAQIDLSANKIIQIKQIASDYYYCVGIINQYLYAENVDHYLIFNLFDE